MKRILYSIFLLGIFIFIAFSAGSVPENLRYAAAKGGLVMRETPDTSGKKIGLIPMDEEVTLLEEKGEAVTIAGKKGKWSKVTWKDKTGWVFGGFLKKDEDFAEIPVIPILTRIMGLSFSFELKEDELADEMEITIDQDSFSGNCYLHGSGDAVFSGTYKAVEKGDTLTLILIGTLKGTYVTEIDKKFEQKINKSEFIIRRKDDKFYGTINISPCEAFTDREMRIK
jgi:hypothetical protein